MFIDIFKNNGIDYLRLVSSKRVLNANGRKVSEKNVLTNSDPLKKFDDGNPEYLERLRKSFRAGVPLIPELMQYCGNNM